MKKVLVLSSFIILVFTFLFTSCSKQNIDPKSINEVRDPNGIGDSEGIVLAVYPNPSSGLLCIQCEGLIKYLIFDCYGQLLTEEDVNNDDAMLELYDFPSGIYTLRLITVNDTYDISVAKL